MKLYESICMDTTEKVDAVIRGLKKELAELKELVRNEDLHPVAKRSLVDETFMVQSLVHTFENLLKPESDRKANKDEIPF
jgi:hypothetical protein